MRIYKNKNTGREITVESELSGAWELVEEVKAEKEVPEKETKPTTKK